MDEEVSLPTETDPEGASEAWRNVFQSFQHGMTDEPSALEWLDLCSHIPVLLPLKRCSPSTKKATVA